MTASAISDAIRASLEAALRQLPAGTTIPAAINSGAIAASAANAAQAMISDPVSALVAVLRSIDGARTITVMAHGGRTTVDISCVGDEACRDIAALLGAGAPVSDDCRNLHWIESVMRRDDGVVVAVSANRVIAPALERAA